MFERRTLATGVLALLVAMSHVSPSWPRARLPRVRVPAHRRGQDAERRGTRSRRACRRGAAGSSRGGGGGSAAMRGPLRPHAGAKDLKTVLFNWTWHMGMLRSGAESELVKTLDYHAAGGTIQVNGQPCTLTKYRVQANYQVPGYRTQIECTHANKQTYTNVETLSGEYAWDEDMPGAELVPGKGKATPQPATLEERRIRLWASPHGAPKAAIAGAAGLPPTAVVRRRIRPCCSISQAKAGAKSTTTLEWQGEKAVLTFPIPDVPGAMATATLVNYLPESVVVTHGPNKTEFIYGKWADWNNPLFKIDALYAGTIVERKNGTVVRSVTAKVTEIGQIYVIMPVPDSVQKAGK